VQVSSAEVSLVDNISSFAHVDTHPRGRNGVQMRTREASLPAFELNCTPMLNSVEFKRILTLCVTCGDLARTSTALPTISQPLSFPRSINFELGSHGKPGRPMCSAEGLLVALSRRLCSHGCERGRLVGGYSR
jgi:hypothetical protein